MKQRIRFALALLLAISAQAAAAKGGTAKASTPPTPPPSAVATGRAADVPAPTTAPPAQAAAWRVPTLVPKGAAPAGMAELQASIVQIDGFCHEGPSSSSRMENCAKLGESFSRGIEGYQRNYEAADYYYKRACDEGMAGGCSYYGSGLRNYGKTEAEKLLGLEYFGKACDLGEESSCFNYKAWTGRDRK